MRYDPNNPMFSPQNFPSLKEYLAKCRELGVAPYADAYIDPSEAQDGRPANKAKYSGEWACFFLDDGTIVEGSIEDLEDF